MSAPELNSPGEHAVSLKAESGASVNNIRIELGGSVIALMAGLAVVIGACGVMMGLDISDRNHTQEKMADLQRQYRMTELKLDDWTVVAHRAGIALPSDYTRGPQGNPDAASFKLKPQKGK